MLTSQVPIFLCSLTLLTTQLFAENPGQPSLDGSKTVVTAAAAKTNLAVTANEDLSFASPGRQVKKFVDAYIKSNDDCLSIIKSRSKRPFTIIDSILGHYGVPAELRYLAVIESELKSTAVSRVGARGPWQLMAQTARELGLKVSGRRDERTNYYKSTRAAALYLRDLHNEFKDWLLVLAAYNAGPVPVYRAIHKSHSRNFWALERYLPAESRQHVKRFIATACYFNQPVPKDVEPMPNMYDLAGDGMQAVKAPGDGMQTMVKGNGTCGQSVQTGVAGYSDFAGYSDIVKTDMREISILDTDEHSQYDNQGSGDHSGAVQSGHSIPAFKIEQCLAWNEPAAY